MCKIVLHKPSLANNHTFLLQHYSTSGMGWWCQVGILPEIPLIPLRHLDRDGSESLQEQHGQQRGTDCHCWTQGWLHQRPKGSISFSLRELGSAQHHPDSNRQHPQPRDCMARQPHHQPLQSFLFTAFNGKAHNSLCLSLHAFFINNYPLSQNCFWFFANHRLAILFPHSWHFQNITTTSGEGTAEGWSLMLMCPETVNTSGDGNSHLRDHEGGDIYWMQPVRLILLCWKPGSCLASECLMLYQQSHPISSESSPEAASQQWRVSGVPSPYGVCFLGFAVTAYERQCGVRQMQKGPSQLWEASDLLAVGLCCWPQSLKLAGAEQHLEHTIFCKSGPCFCLC